MQNWMDIGKALEEMLGPQSYPLAAKLVRDEARAQSLVDGELPVF